MILDYDDQMITGDKCDQNFLTFLFVKKKPHAGNCPDRHGNRTRWMRSNDITLRPRWWANRGLLNVFFDVYQKRKNPKG